MKKGWETKNLGDICRFIDYRGRTPDKKENGLRLITAKNVKMGFLQKTPMEFVDPESYDTWMTRGIPKKGDVLFTTEAPLANVAQLDTDEKVVFAQRIIVLQPLSNNLDRTFLKYLLLSDLAQNRIHDYGTGATVKGIKSSLLKKIPIEYPSITEQQRIVHILDKAFADIATAKANAEKNLQNARALFESHLNSVFSIKANEGWIEKPFENVVDDDCSLSYGIVQPGDEYDNGLPIVRPTDLTTNIIHLSGLKKIDPKIAENYKRTTLKGSEILLCVRGNTGIVSFASSELAGANVTRGIVPIRFKHTLILQNFGYYLLLSPKIQSQIKDKTYGAALMQINIRDLKTISLSFPTQMEKQLSVAKELDILHEKTQRLETLYQNKLTALEELKKSILHKAFSGEL